MAVNYFGPVRLTLGLLPAMRAQRFGHVVNVVSWGVQMKAPKFTAYLASKTALDTWSRIAGRETYGDGVTFTNMRFGLVRTAMVVPTEAYEDRRALTPEQAAARVVRALEERPVTVDTARRHGRRVVDLSRRAAQRRADAPATPGSPTPRGRPRTRVTASGEQADRGGDAGDARSASGAGRSGSRRPTWEPTYPPTTEPAASSTIARQSRSATTTKITLATHVAGQHRQGLERVDDPQLEVGARTRAPPSSSRPTRRRSSRRTRRRAVAKSVVTGDSRVRRSGAALARASPRSQRLRSAAARRPAGRCRGSATARPPRRRPGAAPRSRTAPSDRADARRCRARSR